MENKDKKTVSQGKVCSSESKEFNYLNRKIRQGESTYTKLQEQRKSFKKHPEISKSYQENVEKYAKMLITMFKDGMNNSVVANQYLFEVMKDIVPQEHLRNGIYKVTAIKKTDDAIICKIQGMNYENTIEISNTTIMKKKPAKDRIEDILMIDKYYKDIQRNEIIKKTRAGKTDDFLMEITGGDSVIINIRNKKITKVNPDNIIEEIKNYIRENDEIREKNEKIQIAMKFLNESQKQLSSEYLKAFLDELKHIGEEIEREETKIAGEREDKETIGSPQKTINTAQTLMKLLNQENIYFHKENDIDKSAIKFLLRRIGLSPDKTFHDIDRKEAEALDEGIFFDMLGTTNGIKIKETKQEDSEGHTYSKRKIIISEHTDESDEALFSNRSSSSMQMIFSILKRLGLIKQEELPQMERFVNFVNMIDSMGYQINGIDYEHNHETIFGLHHCMHIKDIFEYFKNPKHTGFERLPVSYMKSIRTYMKYGNQNISLREMSQKQKRRIENNQQKFENLQKAGKEFEDRRGVKFIVDVEESKEKQIQDGPQTSTYHGYGFFSIKAPRGNIYIYSPKSMPATIKGFPTESKGHFLIINTPTESDLKIIFEKFRIHDKELQESIIKRLQNIQQSQIAEKTIELAIK